MKINPATISRGLTALYAGLVTVIPLLIDQHVISATVGTDIGVTVTAIAAGWHGGRYATVRTVADRLPVQPPVQEPATVRGVGGGGFVTVVTGGQGGAGGPAAGTVRPFDAPPGAPAPAGPQ